MTKDHAAQTPPVVRRKPSPSQGLTREEVLAREQNGLVNTPVKPPQKTVLQIILSHTFTYFNLLFFALAGCLIAVGSSPKNLMFLGIVFCNTAIGIVQEIRAERTLSRLNLVSSRKSQVVRDGRERAVPSEALVLDDVVLFSAGNQIPADATVLAGELQVNESLITGEADEITRRPGDELLSGSFVISGHAAAVLTAVGEKSFVSRLTLEAKKRKKQDSPGMMRSLSLLVRIIGIFIIPLGVCLYLQQLERGTDVLLAMESSVSSIIGMVPEGLYLLASSALALAVIRLGRRGIVSHNLNCVETLARVDVLCVDKTGTITEDVMHFAGIVPVASAGLGEGALYELLTDFAAASDADNATIRAIQEALETEGRRPPQKRIPFSSRYKFSAVSFSERENYLLGAPEALLGSRYTHNIAPVHEYIRRGMRVLCFARCDSIEDGDFQGSVTPLCFVLLENRIREGAEDTFRYFAEQGVGIRVISGDNPEAVSEIALSAGIAGAERYIDMSTVTSEKALVSAAERYTVFGRVTPEQKRALIRAMKRAGHTVAMTGDGVNDVLALKEANCSIAMASGSDVAAGVSQIVLLNNDFSAMPHVVAEGRQVINNIQRSASLYLVKNIFSFFTALFLLFTPLTYPLQPVQLSLLSALTIGVPSFFLALEPNRERISGSFLRNVLSRALPAGLTDFCLLAGLMLFLFAFPTLSAGEVGTVAALVLCLVGFLFLFSLCRPFNLWRGVLFCLLAVAFVVAVLCFPTVFLLSPLSLGAALLLVVFCLLSIPCFLLFGRIQKSLAGLALRLRRRFTKK